MPHRFQFNESVLHSVVGGRSTIDMPKLNIQGLSEAEAFIKSYGFDLAVAAEAEKLWYFHRRALVLMEEKLGFSKKDIPEVLQDRKQLLDLRKLLVWASSKHPNETELQRWSCAILRVMHVFVHAESDLFSSFSEEIQKQILTPFQSAIYHEGTSGTTYLKRSEESKGESEALALVGFEVKPFKTSSSTVIKLLAKPDALAMSVFDKLGVRFITRSMFDSFRVIRFLVDENLINYPHIMPDQSSNTLYPVDLFCQTAEELVSKDVSGMSDVEINQYFQEKLESNKDKIQWVRKENNFSGEDYRFIKFICRKMIRIQPAGSSVGFSFFFPYEVQIMDENSHQKILSGPSQHQAYKERQRVAARKRILTESTDT